MRHSSENARPTRNGEAEKAQNKVLIYVFGVAKMRRLPVARHRKIASSVSATNRCVVHRTPRFLFSKQGNGQQAPPNCVQCTQDQLD